MQEEKKHATKTRFGLEVESKIGRNKINGDKNHLIIWFKTQYKSTFLCTFIAHLYISALDKCSEMPSLALENAGAHCKLCSTMNGVARWTKQSDRKIISPNSVNRPTYIRISIYLQLHSAYKYTHTQSHITSISVNVSTNSAFVFAKQIQLIFRFECRFLFLLFVFLSLLIRSFACCLLACLRPACRFVRFLFSCSDTIVHLCILPMSISVFLANARASVIISLTLILKRLSSFLAERQCVYMYVICNRKLL